jgi:hypothetical protein
MDPNLVFRIGEVVLNENNVSLLVTTQLVLLNFRSTVKPQYNVPQCNDFLYCNIGKFEAEGLGLPCTAWAGSGLLVKSRLIRIRADEGAREGARERTSRTFEIELVLAAAGRDIHKTSQIGTP